MNKVCIYAYTLLLAFLGGPHVLVAQSAAQPQLSLTVSIANASVKAGSDKHIAITLKNNSHEDLSFTRGPGPYFAYEVLALDSTGKPVAKTRSYRDATEEKPGVIHGGSYVIETLKPGEEFHQEMPLDEFYELARPDKYTVQLQLKDPASGIIVKSNKLSLTVER